MVWQFVFSPRTVVLQLCGLRANMFGDTCPISLISRDQSSITFVAGRELPLLKNSVFLHNLAAIAARCLESRSLRFWKPDFIVSQQKELERKIQNF